MAPGRLEARPALSSLQLVQRSGTLGADGKSEPLAFVLPPDAVGVVVQARGDPKVSYVISDVTDGTQQLVHGPAAKKGGFTDAFEVDREERQSPNRAELGERAGSASVLLPNNPKVQLRPGKGWQVRVQGFRYEGGKYLPANGPVKLDVIIKRAPKAPTAGRLNLHLFFNGSGGYTRATARDSKVIANMLAKLSETYKKAGIEIGQVTFDDLPSMPSAPKSVAEMEQSFAANPYPDGVGVYFTDQVLGSRLIAGAAGGLPGPAVAPGVPRSGVLISTSDVRVNHEPQAGGAALGTTLSHELAHYLGLFHTRDDFMNMDDPLPDTQDAPDNVMFRTDVGADAAFSPQQAAVLLRHPSVAVTAVA